MSFLGEIKRHKLIQVAAVYAVVAWLLIQIVSTVEAPLKLPDWFDTAVIVLLAVGFPAALMLSWAFKLTSEGLVRDDGTAPGNSGRRIAYALVAALVVAVGWLTYRIELRGDSLQTDSANAPESPAQILTPAADREVLPNSIAVLPFENLSPDPDDAFFADGLHEEILNQLLKLSDLSVISRTTMLLYANHQKPLPEIARELNVGSVMEGSVRFAGDRIRVTMQLIDPDTDVHLWSETYDDDISDIGRIFDIQSDIAMNVANALNAEFSPQEQARIEEAPTQSTEAYTAYLSAQSLMRLQTGDGVRRAIAQIDSALELDPEFAAAWVLKALLHTSASPWFINTPEENNRIAGEASLRALELAPDSPQAHNVRSVYFTGVGQWIAAQQELDRAISLGLNLAEQYALMPTAVGYLSTALDMLQTRRRLDPFEPMNTQFLFVMLDAVGDTEAAMAEYERGREVFSNWGTAHANMMLLLLGRNEIDSARQIAHETDSGPDNLREFIQSSEERDVQLERVRSDIDSNQNPIGFEVLANLAAYLGDGELAVRALRGAVESLPILGFDLWRPVFSEARRTDEFKALVREIGLVDYWREYGWPDLCEPVGEDDFECR